MAKRRVIRRTGRRSRDLVNQFLTCATRIIRRPQALLFISLAFIFTTQPSLLDTLLTKLREVFNNSATTWLISNKATIAPVCLILGVSSGAAPSRDQPVLFLVVSLYNYSKAIDIKAACTISIAIIAFYCSRGYARLLPLIGFFLYFAK